ncbi:CRISPR-associated protein Cas4 [Pseudothermotoga sp. U03pept]|uniref:CRISPR-associated protein Cas4 n=1 Tax=Pseudothermotoga sp. U03pept TaxID=3447012 RepID=UPI003F0FD957
MTKIYDRIDLQALRMNGVKVNYLYVCERKLWLFDRGIQMEKNHEKVLLGKLLSEYAYPEKTRREILIDELIKIDLMDSEEIREIKYSNRLANANRIQVLYYLYYLKLLGVQRKGVINYPKMRRKEEVSLTPEAEEEVQEALKKVEEVLSSRKPPVAVKKSYCSKCAYYEFCFG